MDIREEMDRIYREVPLDTIPWNLSEPPRLLVGAIESGRITPCRTVDLGCGAGNYSVWLAGQGFDVTGIDISAEAIQHARDLAIREDEPCEFVVADLLGDVSAYHNSFDLALDWEVLHHVFPEDRPRFVENVWQLLRRDGLYFSLCFSLEDPAFGGEGSYRTTPLGTILYFSSQEELRALFAPKFEIIELATVEVPGKTVPHRVNTAWLRRR
ncbi:MAG: class I SAM-dependent methyltransferase [candidate division Zixibacteria bacterium]|nr:class I SAM-dependent methyltransferase [candidate division Zixibacteria bacterium]